MSLFSLLLSGIALQYSVLVAANCVQVHCHLTVCATDRNDATAIASFAFVSIMGEDCGSWGSGPSANGQGKCASGRQEWSGEFVIWRAYFQSWYSDSFPADGNFLGGNCWTERKVHCAGGGMCPSQATGQCTIPNPGWWESY